MFTTSLNCGLDAFVGILRFGSPNVNFLSGACGCNFQLGRLLIELFSRQMQLRDFGQVRGSGWPGLREWGGKTPPAPGCLRNHNFIAILKLPILQGGSRESERIS